MKNKFFHCLKIFPYKVLIIIFLLLPFSILTFSGCGLIGEFFNAPDNSSTEKIDIEGSGEGSDNGTNGSSAEENSKTGEKETSQEETNATSSDEAPDAETTAKLEETEIKIKVYYVDEQAQYLIGEERTIKGIYKEDFINAAFNELIKKPSSANIYNLMPEGTKILSAEYVDGYAYLNLSEEFTANKVEDSIVDFLVINCIANTITEIPDVDGVLIEVNLEKLDLFGSLDIKSPIKRNEEIIKK